MNKILIGITGGIGSGKSVVSKVLRTMSLPVYDSDLGARRLMDHDPDVRRQLVETFGAELFAEGSLNRPLLASMIFGHPERIAQVNAIVHPAVKRDFLEWAAAQSSRIVFIESAILFESGFHSFMNHSIAVVAPLETRVERAMSRDHATAEQIQARISNQMPQSELQSRCSFTIVNDGHAAILPQIETIVGQLSDHL